MPYIHKHILKPRVSIFNSSNVNYVHVIQRRNHKISLHYDISQISTSLKKKLLVPHIRTLLLSTLTFQHLIDVVAVVVDPVSTLTFRHLIDVVAVVVDPMSTLTFQHLIDVVAVVVDPVSTLTFQHLIDVVAIVVDPVSILHRGVPVRHAILCHNQIHSPILLVDPVQ